MSAKAEPVPRNLQRWAEKGLRWGTYAEMKRSGNGRGGGKLELQ